MKLITFLSFFIFLAIPAFAAWDFTNTANVYESTDTTISMISTDEDGRILIYFADSVSPICNSITYAKINTNNLTAAKFMYSNALMAYMAQKAVYARVARSSNTAPDYCTVIEIKVK